jgi:hypothetical protein
VLELSSRWGEFFRNQPETGTGYWICSVLLKNGRTLERVVVVGGTVSSIEGSSNFSLSEDEISKFIVTHDKTALASNPNKFPQH